MYSPLTDQNLLSRVFSIKCRVQGLLCLGFVVSRVCYVQGLSCLGSDMSRVCYVQGLSCLGFVMSRVCRVQGLLCLGFVVSRVCCVQSLFVQGLLCLVFVCLGLVMAPFLLPVTSFVDLFLKLVLLSQLDYQSCVALTKFECFSEAVYAWSACT